MSTDTLSKGQLALSLGDYEGAVQLLTQSLLQEQTYEGLVSKSRALAELNNTESSLQDSSAALALDQSRPEAFLSKGIAHFKSGNVKQAQEDFNSASQRSEGSLVTVIKRWLKKSEAELSHTKLGFQGEKKSVPVEKPVTLAEVQKIPEVKIVEAVKSVSGKIAYTWYQTGKVVGVEVNYGLSNKDNLKTNFETRKLEVSFPLGNGSDYDLSLDLFDEIVPETVKVTILLSKIEIVLEKKTPEKSWKSLNAPADQIPVEKEESKTDNQDAQKSQSAPVVPKIAQEVNPPSYPSSSQKKKNWDKIDMEIEEDIKKNKGDYCISDDPMKGIFKQIYDASDEDTKRAMMKSYLTSGGTVLSTNWKEVKEKDYEGKDKPDAPKGQEWRKWEK